MTIACVQPMEVCRIKEVLAMSNRERTERAEKYIEESRRSELHTCVAEDSECLGCDLMRRGLKMLYELGDPTVYRA
jgi:hypothetical protein